MNEVSLRLLVAQALTMKPHPNRNFPPSPYYRFMQVLAQKMQPKLSVELGVCGGGGSLHLALGCPISKVVGVDIVNDHPENMTYVNERCPNFELWLGDSVAVAENIYEEYGAIDILFIDTVHEYQRTWDEFNAYIPYLSDRAVVCFDDLLRIEMGTFWEELPEPKLRLDMLHDIAEGGFGVVWMS